MTAPKTSAGQPRWIDVVGQPLEPMHVRHGDGVVEERGLPRRIQDDGGSRTEGFRDVALHHRVGVDGPFDPVIVLEAPDLGEALGLVAIGLGRLRRLRLARPERRELHRCVELDHVCLVDREAARWVRLAQPREDEVAGAVKRIEAAVTGRGVCGIPMRLGDIDDLDQFKPGIEPVAMQQDVRAVVDEGRRPHERRGDAVASVILPSEAFQRPPQLGAIAHRRRQRIDGLRVEELQVEHVGGAVDTHGLATMAQLSDMTGRAGHAGEIHAEREAVGGNRHPHGQPVAACRIGHQAEARKIFDERLAGGGIGNVDRGQQDPGQDLRALRKVVEGFLLLRHQPVAIVRDDRRIGTVELDLQAVIERTAHDRNGVEPGGKQVEPGEGCNDITRKAANAAHGRILLDAEP